MAYISQNASRQPSRLGQKTVSVEYPDDDAVTDLSNLAQQRGIAEVREIRSRDRVDDC